MTTYRMEEICPTPDCGTLLELPYNDWQGFIPVKCKGCGKVFQPELNVEMKLIEKPKEIEREELMELFHEEGPAFSHYDKRSVEYFVEWLLFNFDLKKKER